MMSFMSFKGKVLCAKRGHGQESAVRAARGGGTRIPLEKPAGEEKRDLGMLVHHGVTGLPM